MEKRMSHIRNIAGAIEDKGYLVRSIRWTEENNAIEVLINWPQMAGEKDFIEKAKSEADGKT